MIWIGLGCLVVSIILMTLVGLVWTGADTPLHKWGFVLGTLFLLAGTLMMVTSY